MKKLERKSMRKYMLNYLDYVEENKGNASVDFIDKHLLKIEFFQAERLIHLIVTITSVIVDIVAFLIGVATTNLICIIIGYMLMCFVIPYIYHYFLLENGVQMMYRQYDYMIKNVSK